MALHPEINPSPEGIPLSIAAAALRAARSSKTSHSGSAYFETGSTADGDGVGIVTGPMAAEHGGIGRLDDEGVLHPLVDLAPLEQAAQAAQAQADSVRVQAAKDAQTLREQMEQVASEAGKASEQAQELAQSALDAANKADGKADTITTTVNGHESKLKDLSASLESTRKTADGALDKSTKVEASVGELSTTLTRDYTPTDQADAKYAAKTELSATAEGLETKITQAASTAQGAVSTANTAKSTADKNTATISQVSKTAQGALDKASTVEQSLDGFKTTVSSTYQPKGNYQPKGDYATKTELNQTADSITSSVSQTYQPKGDYATNSALSSYATKTQLEQTANSITSSVSATAKTAQSALDKASTVEQTASSLSSRISEVASTAQGAVSTANTAKSTADKNTATISQVSKTAQGALDKATTVEQSLDGFKATVSSTYTTRDATLLRYQINGANGVSAWLHLGDWNNSSSANSCEIVFYTGSGYNGQSQQNSTAHIFIKDAWQSTASTTKAFGVTVTLDNADESTLQVLVLASSHNACSVWAHPAWGYWNGSYTVVCSGGSWTHTGEHQSDKPTGAEQEVAYRPNAGANAAAISSIRSDLDTQYTKKSEFDITADGFESRISTTESRIDATSQTVVNEIHDRQRYMRFSDSTGKPTLELGASDSSNKMVLTNDRLEFRVNDNAVAYLGNDRMNINNAEIKNVLILGKYAFMPRDNGNISLQYIG